MSAHVSCFLMWEVKFTVVWITESDHPLYPQQEEEKSSTSSAGKP